MSYATPQIVKNKLLNFIYIYAICAPYLIIAIQAFKFSVAAHHQQFSALATSFLNGSLALPPNYERGFDAVYYLGQYYWPLGPFPAVLLMPFVKIAGWFGSTINEAGLHFFLFAGIGFIWYQIAKKLHYSKRDSLYWSYAFCFSSSLIGVGAFAQSWQFAHLVAVLAVSAALHEHLTKNRAWIIGLLMGFTVATRITAGLGILFFILTALKTNRNKLKYITLLMLPFCSSMMLLLFYNYSRFGNILEQGYKMQILYYIEIAKARSYGIFSLIHLPGNLYYFLFAAPRPINMDLYSRVLRPPYLSYSYWGMGLFFISPYYVYLLFLRRYDWLDKVLFSTILIIALPIFCYYGIGVTQYGYRYSLDFLPFLFLLFIHSFGKQFKSIPLRLQILIIFACIYNLLLVTSPGQS